MCAAVSVASRVLRVARRSSLVVCCVIAAGCCEFDGVRCSLFVVCCCLFVVCRSLCCFLCAV